MKLGVIGLRSRHTNFFRNALSTCFPGGEHSVTHVCGYDAPDLLPFCRDLTVCSDPRELICATDAVIITLRDGTQHAALAELCLKEKRPVFVDKPFTCAVEDAIHIQKTAQLTGTPCTGGSTIRFTEEVERLAGKLPQEGSYTLSYQADPFSPFGGWYFYGSHLTDLCVTLFGCGWQNAAAQLRGSKLSAVVHYPGFSVLLRSSTIKQPPVLQMADRSYVLDDQGCYQAGIMHFLSTAEGTTLGRVEELVSSVRLMDAILISLREGGRPYPESPGGASNS